MNDPKTAKRIRQAIDAAQRLRSAPLTVEYGEVIGPEEWADIARTAGELQRRARVLAGLGRGG